MEPIWIVVIVIAVVAVVGGLLLVRRPGRGEVLEPPPGAPPHAVGATPTPSDQLDAPEVEIVDPISTILADQVVITGPELTPEEEAANIAAAEAAELDGELEALVEAERPSFR